MLEPDDDIVGESHNDHVTRGLMPSPALGPEIEHVVQVEFASSGEITEPWTVPFSLTVTTPSWALAITCPCVLPSAS